MDATSLSLKITTDGMEQAQAKMDGVTRSAAVLEAQSTKLASTTARLGPASRMTGQELDDLKASYEKLHVKQDMFLQGMDKQAATLGKGAAAMRAYQAEQLGLTDDKIFQRLNAQITDAESGMTKMSYAGSMVENVIMRMGVHMLILGAAIKGVTWVFDELVNGATKWLVIGDKIRELNAKDSLSLANLVKGMREENLAYADGSNAVGGLNGHLERQAVIRAKFMEMGPQYRKIMQNENIDLQTKVELLKIANAEELRRVNAEIKRTESNAPDGSWKVGFGLAFGGGLGNIIAASGLRDDADAALKREERIKTLYAQQSALTESTAVLDGAYDKAGKHVETLTEKQEKYRQKLAEIFALHMDEGKAFTETEMNNINLMTQKLGLQQASFDVVNSMAKLQTTNKNVPGNLLNGPAVVGDRTKITKLTDATTEYLKNMKELAASGDAWAIIGQTVVETSSYAADALTRWSNNLDGLGVSWTTLGTTVRNVLADMVRQMERTIIEQKLMQPLMNWASNGDNWLKLFGFGGGKADGGSIYGGTTYLVGERGPELFTPGTSGTITPNHALGGGSPTIVNNISVSVADGKVSDSSDAGKNGEEIAKSVKGLINQWAQEQSRSGGVLARQ